VPDVVRYRPAPEEFAYTFGGREPVRRVGPDTILELYTEDCFGGRVRSVDDLPSQVCEFPYLNPVTGPSGGVESGSTVPVSAFSLFSGLAGDGRRARQVSRTGLRCRA
jgi:amidase